MVLILAGSADPLAALVAEELERRGLAAAVIEHLFAPQGGFAWRFGGTSPASRFTDRAGLPVETSELRGVFVRSTPPPFQDGWADRDLHYLREEFGAATLGWLTSLACPVVGRLPAWLFFAPHQPLSAWLSLLQGAGLPTLDTALCGDADGLRAWRAAHPGGAVLFSQLGGPSLLLATPQDWDNALPLLQHGPVPLKEPHGPVTLACIVGRRVVWNGGPPANASRLEAALLRFAAAASVNFVQVSLAPVPDETRGLVVVAVTVEVELHRFLPSAQQAIAQALVDALVRPAPLPTGAVFPGRRTPPPLWEAHP